MKSDLSTRCKYTLILLLHSHKVFEVFYFTVFSFYPDLPMSIHSWPGPQACVINMLQPVPRGLLFPYRDKRPHTRKCR